MRGTSGLQKSYLRLVLNSFAMVLCTLTSIQDVRAEKRELLNVSFDPTRKLYERINRGFIQLWRERTGEELVVYQSHGGSGKQARSVIEGLEADVVTLALSYDIDNIAQRGLIASTWKERFPYGSVPCSSIIVFLVRKGNPKAIRDWPDLARKGVEVVMPNPKTSGGARWNYLAAWGFGMKRLGDEPRTRELVASILANVRVFDTGARGSMTTFLHREIGDVLVTWESEARELLSVDPDGSFELVVPSVSIKAETPVAVVDANIRRHKTEAVASAYVEFLFSPAAQRVFAEAHYRPSDAAVRAQFESSFPAVQMLSIDVDFGGWAEAHRVHFSEGGTFDRMYGG
jgi:sulfate transport system substrate-binding protein